jgi:lipoprotein NlpI
MNVAESLNQAVQRFQSGQTAEAEMMYRRILGQQPDFAPAHYHLGNALKYQNRFDEAIASYHRALQINPDYPQALNNLGNTFREIGKFTEALACFRRAATLGPDIGEVQYNLGNTLRDMYDYDQAETCYRRATELSPEMAAAHWNLGLLLLLKGDYTAGWREYQWRWQVRELQMGRGASPQPEWDGQPLNGRRILIYADQGLGDTIQFLRYLPLVADRGGKVLVVCHPDLIRVFRCVPRVEEWVAFGQPLPQHDVQCPWMSLPAIFGTTLQTIPSVIPYILADPELSRRWSDRLAPDGRLRVGLTWAGRPWPDPLRSIPTELLTPLGQVPGLRLVSLQRRPSEEQVAYAPPPLVLDDWTGEFRDVADMASLMEHLDLVITIDTVVAHLAGAMGKKTWVLLKKYPDWRWMLDRSDSPWYPNTRLFRQARPGDWTGPVARIIQELK